MPARDILADHRAFVVQDSKGKEAIYAWFQEQEFELLKTPAGEKVLQSWLASLPPTLHQTPTAGGAPELASDSHEELVDDGYAVWGSGWGCVVDRTSVWI